MKKVELTTSISIYESIQELPKDVEVLMQKAIDAKEHWPKEKKLAAKQRTLEFHQNATKESFSTDGKYANFSAQGLENYYDVQKLLSDRISKIPAQTLQSTYGLTAATNADGSPMTDEKGNPQFYEYGTTKTVSRSDPRIKQLTNQIIQNNRFISYLIFGYSPYMIFNILKRACISSIILLL